MDQFETRLKQVEVLPLVKHFMNELDLFNLCTKYVPAAAVSLADHAESLCILTAILYATTSRFTRFKNGCQNSQVFLQQIRLRRVFSTMFDSHEPFRRFLAQTGIR